MAAESSSEPAAAVTSDDDQQPLAANGDVPAPGPPAQDPDFVTLGMFIIGMCTSLATCVWVRGCVCLCVLLAMASDHFCLGTGGRLCWTAVVDVSITPTSHDRDLWLPNGHGHAVGPLRSWSSRWAGVLGKLQPMHCDALSHSKFPNLSCYLPQSPQAR